eukprot:Awhi_evm1s8596
MDVVFGYRELVDGKVLTTKQSTTAKPVDRPFGEGGGNVVWNDEVLYVVQESPSNKIQGLQLKLYDEIPIHLGGGETEYGQSSILSLDAESKILRQETIVFFSNKKPGDCGAYVTWEGFVHNNKGWGEYEIEGQCENLDSISTVSLNKKKCGMGEGKSTRTCKNEFSGFCKDDDGDDRETQSVDYCWVDCPIDGVWSDYTYTQCSESCGSGTRTGTRTCSKAEYGGYDCEGEPTIIEPCNTHLCPVDGSWSAYSYTQCSASCGSGTRTGTRTCTNPTPANGGNE